MMRKTASPQASHAEMLQACRRTENSVASAKKCRDPVGEVSHSIAIVVIRCALIEQIAIDIGCNHEELIDETNEQRLVLTGPGRSHCFLHDIVAHAVSDEGHLRFTGFRRIIYGLLLLLGQPIE